MTVVDFVFTILILIGVVFLTCILVAPELALYKRQNLIPIGITISIVASMFLLAWLLGPDISLNDKISISTITSATIALANVFTLIEMFTTHKDYTKVETGRWFLVTFAKTFFMLLGGTFIMLFVI